MKWFWFCIAFAGFSEKCERPIGPPPCKGAIERCQQDVRPVPPRRECDRFSRVPCRVEPRWRSER